MCREFNSLRPSDICVSKLNIIGSDNGLSPGRRQAIISTNAGILLIRPSGTNFSEILIAIHTFSFNKVPSKMSSGNWRPFCIGLNMLRRLAFVTEPKAPNTYNMSYASSVSIKAHIVRSAAFAGLPEPSMVALCILIFHDFGARWMYLIIDYMIMVVWYQPFFIRLSDKWMHRTIGGWTMLWIILRNKWK